VTWTNIGLLYLQHGDLDLANQAFYRAQTLDPDYQVAWVGQALVATAHGDNTEAEAMFEHAVDLPAMVVSDLMHLMCSRYPDLTIYFCESSK
jgi:superkiller protein 3